MEKEYIVKEERNRTHRFRRQRFPIPDLTDQLKIKRSLGLKRNDKFFKCPARSNLKARKLAEKGEQCEDCNKPGKSPCHKCRCSNISGSGTEHYGCGFCWNHEGGMRAAKSKEFAKNQAHAIQQGYPVNPVRYKSKNEILIEIQEEETEAREKLSTMRELDLLRSKMQDLENKIGAKTLTTYKNGELVEASDEDTINMSTKLANSIAKIAKMTLEITDQDYIHVNEIKLWLSAIVTLTRSEIQDEEKLERWLKRFMEIPQPKAGRKGA